MTTSDLRDPDSRRDAIIFDVDGTLCDVRTIRHFVQRSAVGPKFKPNFNDFHSASIECPPHFEVARLARNAHSTGLAVVVVTGREAKWKDLTVEWLKRNRIPFDELQTREAKDYRQDHVVKAEIEADVSKRFRAILAVDDRVDIIGVWQAAGIVTAQVSVEGHLSKVQAPLGSETDTRLAGLFFTEAL